MEVRNEVVSAVQLIALLCLLFWSFTWNTPKNFDNQSRRQKQTPSSKSLDLEVNSKIWNKHDLVLDSFKNVKYMKQQSQESEKESKSVLPSFEVWKEGEIVKQNQQKSDEGPRKSKSAKRKLNYASSKCGAKILSSNPEAKHRAAILTDKAEEYMLSLCKSRTWFVIELCDTVLATQIEIANFELYSSSPKQFSAFWSDVYPTQNWQYIGMFHPEDTRTMQTFNVDVANLGKFIKITISGHYGKEHYCPLSVVRVLGYSMIYEFEEVDEKKVSLEDKPIAQDLTGKELKHKENFGKCLKFDIFFQNLAKLNLKNASSMCMKGASKLLPENSCINPPLSSVFKHIFSLNKYNFCSLLNIVSSNHQFSNSNLTCPRNSTACNIDSNFDAQDHQYKTFSDILKELSEEAELKSVANAKYKAGEILSKVEKKPEMKEHQFRKEAGQSNKTELLNEQDLTHEKRFHEDLPEVIDSRDSATLIQKESVLMKLSIRIKNSEMNVILINKYLQELSKSYREQMRDVQSMFNDTVKALEVAAAKAILVDVQQQAFIDNLKIKVGALSKKVHYLESINKSLIMQVFELHGFFLILEFIIMSTIFSIVINKIRQSENKIKGRFIPIGKGKLFDSKI